jgi:phage baseplate assembly protein W
MADLVPPTDPNFSFSGIDPNDPADMSGADFPVVDNDFYRSVNAIWPNLLGGQATVAPARNGMNRKTGKVLQGWGHVEQSIELIFATPYHERVLRRWVGSFVPMLLGETFISRIIMRFYWAMATGIDLWEPNYRIRQIYFMGDALAGWSPEQPMTQMSAAGMIRIGQAIFRNEGVYRPRAHIGDFSPFEQKQSALIGYGDNMWDVKAVP